MATRRLHLFLATAAVVSATAALAAPQASAGVESPARGYTKAHVVIDRQGRPSIPAGQRHNSVWGSGPTAFSADRTGVGRYSITFTGITTSGGNAQLVAWGRPSSTNPPVCSISGWGGTPDGQIVDVNCFDARTGQAREGHAFDVMFTNVEPGPEVSDFTYLWSYRPKASFYSAVLPYTYSADATADVPVVQRLGRGLYDVHIREDLSDVWPYVTAYSSRARWCNPVTWTPDTTQGVHVEIACFGAGGTARDSRFSLVVARGDLATGVGDAMSNGASLRIGRPGASGVRYPTTFNTNWQAPPPANSHERQGEGVQTITMPLTRYGVPVPFVQALGTTGKRCVVTGLVTGAAPTTGGMTTRCMTADGDLSDTKQVAYRWDKLVL